MDLPTAPAYTFSNEEEMPMSIEVVPTGAALGAEIRGVNLAEPLGDNVFAIIERAFDEHGVIFFRDQKIDPPQQVAFTRRFGDIAFNIFGERWSVPGSPEIVVVSNVLENGEQIGVKRAGENWHSDMCYTARPPRGTMLYAHEIPTLYGLPLGDTEFANAAAAWDALPPTMQSFLAGRRATFDFCGRKRALAVTQDEIDRNPPVTHPIARTHPKTARKCLYVMRDDCIAIDGVEPAEAETLIAALADHIVKPAFIYRHQWRPGDLLMWDNCTVQHRAIQDYDLPQRRVMHRTTMGGYAPT
jgi:taurine dioxygenase